MAHIALPAAELALVARSLPDRDTIADPRLLAWEVLRRRGDYRGAAAIVEQIGTENAPIELIRPHDDVSQWGLRFR